MLNSLPTPPTLTANMLVQTQDTGQSPDSYSDARSKIGAKKYVLRYLLDKEVKANESEGIVTSASVSDLKSGSYIYTHQSSKPHFAASVNKLGVAWLLAQDIRAGKLALDAELNWQESDKRLGAGVYDQTDAPLKATIRQLLHDMLNRSGNTAVRILVNSGLGGPVAVNNRLALDANIPVTRLMPLDATRFYLGNSTTNESLYILKQLLEGDDPVAKEIKQMLATNIYTDMGARAKLAGNDYIVLANKTGILDDPDGNNRHDVGIVYNTRTKKSFGYSFFITSPHASQTATRQAEQSLKGMGGYVLRYAGDMPSHGLPVKPFSEFAPSSEPKVIY